MRHVLTIAGSDSGGGAGIQADLKTFLEHGVFGMSVITAITAQSPRRVTRVDPVPVESIVAQLETVIVDLPLSAVKIGMLGTAETVRAVAGLLRQVTVPIVLDPVMVSTSGARLLDEDAEQALAEELLPLATLVTPNLPEAAVLAGSQPVAAWAANAPTSVLVTGGDAEGAEVVDTLYTEGEVKRWTAPRIGGGKHGTGCTLSSALASRLALGDSLEAATEHAIRYTQALVKLSTTMQLHHGQVALLRHQK